MTVVIPWLSFGCAPRRPATFDYAPDWVGPSMPCSLAESAISSTMREFHDGEPPPEKYSECITFLYSMFKYSAPENGCAVSPEKEVMDAMVAEYIGSRARGAEFLEWIKPCSKTINDANTYAAALQDYVTKEGVNSLSLRDSMVILGAAALAGGH